MFSKEIMEKGLVMAEGPGREELLNPRKRRAKEGAGEGGAPPKAAPGSCLFQPGLFSYELMPGSRL